VRVRAISSCIFFSRDLCIRRMISTDYSGSKPLRQDDSKRKIFWEAGIVGKQHLMQTLA